MTQSHCDELINKMARHDFAQINPLPALVTDHPLAISYHIYSSQVHTLLKYSDHFKGCMFNLISTHTLCKNHK